MGFLAALILTAAVLGQPALADVLAPENECCSVAPSRIPGIADDIADQVDETIARVDDGLPPPPGVKGGRTWRNDGTDGGQRLPEQTADGSKITYREWGINPPGPDGRDALRVVTGSDGSAWFRGDHYVTFTQIRGGS